MNKPLTRAEWLEWLDTTWKKCLHEAWDKELADMKDDDDTQVYRSEMEAAVKAEREAILKLVRLYVNNQNLEEAIQARGETRLFDDWGEFPHKGPK